MERSLTLTALFAALTAALALMPPVMLGFGVPITAQTLGIMLCGTVLGAVRGGLAAALYVVLGLVGLPIFAGGSGGLGVLAGPTVGFILGFPIAAFVTGFAMQQMGRLSVGPAAFIASVLGGVLVLYIFGIFGMMMVLDLGPLAAAGLVTAFIPGDIVKAVLAGVITAGLYRARPRAVFSRA